MFKRNIKIELAVEITAGQGVWEAKSEGIDIVGCGQTPDDACKDFEKRMKEGRTENKVRQVIQYEPKAKVEEIEEGETLASVEGEAQEKEGNKEVVFKKRGRPRKNASSDDDFLTEVV